MRRADAALLNWHSYEYNVGHQRTKQTFAAGNYVDYTYDDIGQLKTAKGWEAGGSVARANEQFGYAYDAAWNLNRRTNNALVQTFDVDSLNQLSSGSRSGTFTVAGVASQPGANLSSVSVSGTGLSSGNADIYADGAWARTNATLADGNNSYTATALDTYGRTASDSVTVNLPATPTFQYDGNGNLTNDGRRVLEYDFENQLTNVYVASGWRSEFRYDAFGRQRVRREYTWSSGAWLLTNEVRLVYDGMLVVQERDANNLAQVSYTRGNDLSGSLQGAGGIGGLLARTDNSLLVAGAPAPHAYYHCDGNGNVTALVSTNGIILARYSYDPYGNLLGMSGPLAEANRYRFSSKEWNGNAGLYYYGYRFYDGGLQRWLNRDPIEEEGGINLYAFVDNDPLQQLDSWGLCGPEETASAAEKAADIAKEALKEANEAAKKSSQLARDAWGKDNSVSAEKLEKDARGYTERARKLMEEYQVKKARAGELREAANAAKKASRFWPRAGRFLMGVGGFLITLPARIPMMFVPIWEDPDYCRNNLASVDSKANSGESLSETQMLETRADRVSEQHERKQDFDRATEQIGDVVGSETNSWVLVSTK